MASPGRPKGSPNKVTASIKEVYEKVFHELQLTEKHALLGWAKNNQTDFYRLIMHLIPKAIEANVTENKITRIEIVMADDRTNTPLGFAAETADSTTIQRH